MPLPPGTWKATHTAEVPEGANKWKAYVLTNQDPQSPVAAVVVRDMDARMRWGPTACENPAWPSNAEAFMSNTHGTKNNQLINKCSRVFGIGKLSPWRDSPSVRSGIYWKDSLAGLQNFASNDDRQFLLAQSMIQEFNGRGLRYEFFVQAPQGKTSGQFRDEYRAGLVSTEHQLLEGWISVVMESMQQSYLGKKPQPGLMALGYKTRGSSGEPAVAVAAASTTSASVPPTPTAMTPMGAQPTSVSTVAKSVAGQPLGSIFQGSLPLGTGSSVPLPPGRWRLGQTANIPQGSHQWAGYVLINLDPKSSVPAVVVRDMDAKVQWGNFVCPSPGPADGAFMINAYGTQSDSAIKKCSRVSPLGYLAMWRDLPEVRNNDWWKELRSGFRDFDVSDDRRFLMAEARLYQNDGRGLRYELFVEAPQGNTTAQFREAYQKGALTAEHRALEAWMSDLMDSVQKSYLDRKPSSALVALDFKTRSATTLAQVSAPPIAAVPPPSTPAGAPVAAPQPTKPVAPVTASAPVAITAASVPTASAAPTAATSPVVAAAPKPPAPSPVADAEARELRQQLEKMQQMIAQLQAANAASAKAAALAAEQSAVVAAPVSKQPVAKPILANRKALIIGNDLYTDVPKLSNAAADADAMAKSLEQVGFQVFKHLNVNEKGFKQALRDFRLKVQGGDEVLFFFAGHGVQLGAANYLLPTDIKGDHEEQVKDEAIQLQKVLDDLQDKKTKFALAVVDACRDNPFKGQGRAIGGRGLAPTTAATGQMIIFSAGSGQQALDKLGPADKDRNGLFTRIFVKEMLKPGVSVDRVLRNVRNEVVRLAQGVGHEQTPALYDQAVGEFFFLQ